MNKIEFAALHGRCTTVMNIYLAEAQKTCGMLGKSTPGPLSFMPRFALLRQEIREKNAHLIYLEAKRLLHGAALLGYVAA